MLELWGEWRSHTVLSCSTRSLARNHSITAKHYQGPQGYPGHGYLWSITRRKGNWNYRMKQYYSTLTVKQQYTVTERTVRNVHQWLNIGSLKIGLIKSSRTVSRLQDTISWLGFIYVFPLFPILLFLLLIINWKYKHKDEGRTQALTASLQKKKPFHLLSWNDFFPDNYTLLQEIQTTDALRIRTWIVQNKCTCILPEAR